VYKSGFATTQVSYDRAQQGLYAALDEVESRLQSSHFLLGDRCALMTLILQIPKSCGPALDRAYIKGRGLKAMTSSQHLRRFTEADLRLYPTIIRYDSVYTTLFRCARRRVSDYPALARWRQDVYNLHVPAAGMQVPIIRPWVDLTHMLTLCHAFARLARCYIGQHDLSSVNADDWGPDVLTKILDLLPWQQIRDSFDLPDAMRSYFLQLFPLNPSAIVPSGPTLQDLGLEEAPAGHSDSGEAFHRQQAAQPVIAAWVHLVAPALLGHYVFNLVGTHQHIV
jgi:glutathionyl-hydroquinone reductase